LPQALFFVFLLDKYFKQSIVSTFGSSKLSFHNYYYLLSVCPRPDLSKASLLST